MPFWSLAQDKSAVSVRLTGRKRGAWIYNARAFGPEAGAAVDMPGLPQLPSIVMQSFVGASLLAMT